ncbi:TetR/AcrR family transcriptional regulator [Rhodococcus sp. ACT016]|uniref:TetR/AcrR family transcriptional regulator n=1 Tax=Rhodococcus sp. ACT016 TaxID=3134808 RepID=UPI003D2D4F4A
MTGSNKRRYRSQIQRGEAAPAIIAAATRLFAERGYPGTSIEDIARAAAVARPTVFTAVGAKPVIFRAVLEAAVAGPDPVIPVLDQEWTREMGEEPDPRRMLALLAHRVRVIGERISELYWAAEVAAQYDPAVRDVWDSIESGRLGIGDLLGAALAGRGSLRPEYDAREAAAVITTIASPASWRALVRDRGWTPDRFESWARESLCLLLLPEQLSAAG